MLEKEQNEIKESKDEHNKETENADEIHKMNGDLAKKYEINFPHENDRLDKFFFLHKILFFISKQIRHVWKCDSIRCILFRDCFYFNRF